MLSRYSPRCTQSEVQLGVAEKVEEVEERAATKEVSRGVAKAEVAKAALGGCEARLSQVGTQQTSHS